MTNLQNAVKKMMSEENVTEVQAISALQSAAVQMGNDEVLEALIEMKNKILESMFA